jgi:hypothetical protein
MSKELYLNGIDAATGGPIDGDLTIDTELVARVARGQRLSPEDLKDVRLRKVLDAQKKEHFGVSEGIDACDLSQTGWGVVLPAGLPQKSVDGIKDALKPLLDLRKEQASHQDSKYYREFIGPELGYQRGESKNEFLKRFGRGPGPADPSRGMPYYLLLAGSHESIPFSFQSQLDVQYAVGRIYFGRLEDYYQYAQSVVALETQQPARSPKAVFFGVANPDDRATALSSTQLIQPLAQHLSAQCKDWQVDIISPESATKSTLGEYMGGKKTPALFFSASHGVCFKPDDPRLLPHTGAILTQDWPGLRTPVTDKMYFSADDIGSDADVFGMIAFIFACYSGGIPRTDPFYRQAFGVQKELAPYAFVSQLPLKLLSHPRGGALGVFAHVERAWGSSIAWDGAVQDIETFDSTLQALLNGKPAGAATEYFNQRYAEISTMLTEELDLTSSENQDDVRIAGMWTSNNDARNYTFIGDPAVRLAVGEMQTGLPERQELGAINSILPASLGAAAATFQPDVVDRALGLPAVSDLAGETYGLGDIFKKDETSAGGAPGISASLKSFADKLGTFLSKTLDDATSFEISTYVADDLNNVTYANGKYSGASLRAMTRISLDGGTLVCLAEKDGAVDSAVSQLHLEMVKSAQENRTELMKTIVGAAANIVNIVR